jgi:hypothetical protein
MFGEKRGDDRREISNFKVVKKICYVEIWYGFALDRAEAWLRFFLASKAELSG